ncbi:MAG: hypothetical protein A2508_07210 [Candidatus Lambdaproteobacteria bacterium RIFOXYD12_FULL_49_8]|uniref:Mce/MlaD domain-containing protein n=1 Tax=Candidatus Lambdaproteobacteria bacterium RIFOXYD2_FULL_50_16 TaxID=1817772 RepID=A0A1F6G7J6_9PROT|nr:MAG: hypothetical protein A2527_09510 [Candidatus Lambdaproteobacteria bacterium RIFOXYD2_FULL_50_16]OGG97318.1 MAG: hypothetical protein A2508_07210 [Candidatus Lambdaproteobacteria bacterium RIFOXYD12_FULL_49_8]
MLDFLKKLARLKTEMNVGLLVLAAMAFLAIASIKVTRYDPDLKGTYRLKVTFDNVSGLALGTAVKVAGIQVGEINDIDLVDGRAEVTLLVYDKYRLRTNSQAMIKSIGILGDKYIEVTLGDQNQQTLQNGDRIQLIAPGGDLDSLVEDLSYILSDVRNVTSAINAAVGGERGEKQIKAIMDNLENLTGNLDQTLIKTNEKIGGILANLETLSSDLAQITGENKEELRNTIANFRDFSESLNRFIDANSEEINKSISSLDKLLARLAEDGPEITGDLKGILKENRQNLKDTMAEIKAASENLNSAMDQVESIAYKIDTGEGTVGRLINDEQTIDSIQSALDGVNEFINPINKLKIEVGFESERLLNQGTNKSYVDVKLRPVRDHYYILRLVNHPSGKITSTRTKTVDTSTDVVISDETAYQSRDTFRMSLMVAQRFFDTELLFGLYENTAGFGVHQFFGKNDQYRFNLDLYEFSRADLPVHLTTGGYWRFTQNFYAVAGMDDALNTQSDQAGKKLQNPYVGIGISFTEDYMKSLLGPAATAVTAP